MPPARDAAKSKKKSPPRHLLVAVDTGGTKTAAWLVESAAPDGHRVLGQARSSAGNPLSVGFAKATSAIGEAIALAREEARLADHRVSRAILSIAGAANRDMTEKFIAWARSIGLAERVAIVSDVLPVLAAGTPDCCGVALIAGTGSVAFGRSADGRFERFGGWGYLLGDEGSGYAIGRSALRQALHSLESGTTRRPLSSDVLKVLGVDSVTELTRAIYGSTDPRHAIAALAPLVATAADEGDADAQTILDDAACDLAKLAVRAVHSAGMSDGSFSLAVSGGVLAKSKRLQEQLRAELEKFALKCEMIVVTEPLEGCVRLADDKYAGTLVTWHNV